MLRKERHDDPRLSPAYEFSKALFHRYLPMPDGSRRIVTDRRAFSAPGIPQSAFSELSTEHCPSLNPNGATKAGAEARKVRRFS
jgi:hypothetical protein